MTPSNSLSRRDFLRRTAAGTLALSLSHLQWIGAENAWAEAASKQIAYRSWQDIYQRKWRWDKVVKSTHFVNCWYQASCNFNVYVKNGIVWREEQSATYPQTNSEVPDFNPRGCQKGACYSDRMYDPTRLKYPLKRVGKRGEGKWKRVSWDEALTEIADGFIDTLGKEGPAAIHWDTGTQHSFGGPQGLGLSRTAFLLDTPLWDLNPDVGDEHQGSAVTCGKIIFCSSADDMFHAKLILNWGGNPITTQMPNFHFITEARYHGTKFVSITPDYSPTSIHADLWVPVKLGSDAALGLALSQVIVADKLYNAAFLKEQTDMPLLVRNDTRLFLREADLKQGGADDRFYAYDLSTKSIRQMPQATLKLDSIDPALEGEFEVETRTGKVKVRPVFEVLKDRLNAEYTPEQATKVCGTNPELIRRLAREIARAETVTTISQSNFSKFYHGLEMERAQLLVHALCGHFGKKGSNFQAFAMICADAAGDSFLYPNMPLPEGKKAFDQQMAPMAKALKDKGYTDEMVTYESGRQIFRQRSFISSVLALYFHGGVKELMKDQRKWDPAMKRDLDEYVKLALDKGWQFAHTDVTPRILVAEGGNLFRRFRGYPKLLEVLLPKLRLVVDINWRMSNTGRHADFILPCTSWYERDDIRWATPLGTFLHGASRVVEPFAEARSEWTIHCLLAKKIQERAGQRNAPTFKDREGKERHLDKLYENLTYGGNYKEHDDVKLAGDFLKASGNVDVSFEQLAKDGFARFTSIGGAEWNIGNATDLKPNETIVPNTWHIEKKVPWPTLTRRIQFYIDQELYMELGEELPVHKEEKIGGDHPLQMMTPHGRHSNNTSWRDHALMLRLQRGQPVALMNAADAKTRGIADNDTVRVHNDIGSFQINAMISRAVPPGLVMIYHAWEPYMFKGGHSYQTVTPSPINPVELAGGYYHLQPMPLMCSPGENDRGVRIEVEKVEGAGAATGLRI